VILITKLRFRAWLKALPRDAVQTTFHNLNCLKAFNLRAKFDFPF